MGGFPDQPRLAGNSRPHILIPTRGQLSPFRRPPLIIEDRGVPNVAREAQYRKVRTQFAAAAAGGAKTLQARDPLVAEGQAGFYLAFKTIDDRFYPGPFEHKSRNLEMVVARELHKRSDASEEAWVEGAVFVPLDAVNHFERRIEQYGSGDLSATGQPPNAKLVSTIDQMRLGGIADLWTDESRPLPEAGEFTWWEVWVRRDRNAAQRFVNVAGRREIEMDRTKLELPGRQVRWIRTHRAEIEAIALNCDAVAELRSGLDRLAPYELAPVVERERIEDDLVGRVRAPRDGAPTVCVLDTGTTSAHPLLEPAIVADIVARSTFIPGDAHGHGTLVSGMALYGDLREHFGNDGTIPLAHALESVKLIRDPREDPDSESLAKLTADAVARIEIADPLRRRIFCIASTLPRHANGEGTTWSVLLDEKSAEQDAQRLFVVAVGNTRSRQIPRGSYPSLNDVAPIEEPAQAWNVLSVGGSTNLVDITDPSLAGWEALAGKGDLSPHSRTAVGWALRPFRKPDIVFEAGNFAGPAGGAHEWPTAREVALISTSRNIPQFFDAFGATSAAAAQAAALGADVWATNPRFWPETVRGLVVHSAEWTPAMKQAVASRALSRRNAMKRWGHGVPNRARALASANDDLTLIIQDSLQPFRLQNGSPRSNQMSLHGLPLPEDTLRALEGTEIELRITLSYFIEPNTPSKAVGRRYPSHRLNFDLKHPNETEPQMLARLNELARTGALEDERQPWNGNEWTFGQDRARGSIAFDSMRLDARTLADRNAIAVIPSGGWWRDMKEEERVESLARYSLIISLRPTDAVSADIDLYTPVLTKIHGAQISIDFDAT